MAKVQKITVSNLKAVSNLTADFNGCTAIITGGNNKGKTSFLRSLPERLRGNKPELVLKQGESNGFAEWQLTTGERLRWEFNNTTKAGEKLVYISEKEIKGPLTAELSKKFFPATFDVDRFLTDPPMKQRKTLQALVGLDFTDIDKRHKDAYDNREAVNRTAKESKIKFDAMAMPAKVDVVDMAALSVKKEAIRTELNELYLKNKKVNEDARKKHEEDQKEYAQNIGDWNDCNCAMEAKINECKEAAQFLYERGYTGTEVDKFIDTLPKPETKHDFIEPVEPEYPDPKPDDKKLQDIDAEILEATETNNKAALYTAWLKAKELNETAQKDAGEADEKVKKIEQERMDLIKSAKMPEGFSFSDEGILYNGLAFTREQLSSSGIYIAALKLAAMTLGEVKTLHFDASFLDKNSLKEIEEWAHSEGLQLLIERPDYDCGEIEYHIIEAIYDKEVKVTLVA